MNQHCGTIALVGLPNVGKSSILNALLKQKLAPTSPKPQTTRRSICGIVNHDDTQMIFVDTPGFLDPSNKLQGYMRHQAMVALDGVDVVVWVIDAPHHVAKPEQQQRELTELTKLHLPFILLLNKIDKIPDKSKLLPLMTKWSAVANLKAMLPISAKTGDGLDAFVAEISKHLPEKEWLFNTDILTTTSEREIVTELIREKVLLQLGEEIPHQIAVTIDRFDEQRRENKKKPLVEISAILHVERDSQKKIVVGRVGERIKAIGMAARQDIEQVLGCQVMLKLFVRVEPDWSQTSKGLLKLGFV